MTIINWKLCYFVCIKQANNMNSIKFLGFEMISVAIYISRKWKVNKHKISHLY